MNVHRLEAGRPLILGGVRVPHDKGLLGHSDADVLVHAVMDALLGAIAAGDIGKHFSDTDPLLQGYIEHKAAGLCRKSYPRERLCRDKRRCDSHSGKTENISLYR